MKIIFFGDSITETGRNAEDPTDLGVGYVKITAGKLRLLYPETKFEFLNRGIGGNRTGDLLLRVEQDVVNECPDVVILQVGINDVWSRFEGQEITPEEFRKNYEALVAAIKGTGARIVIIEPFVLKVRDKQRFRPYVNVMNAIIREIAERESIPLIPLDEIFTGVTQDIEPSQFAEDGIHPTHRGCRYIADLLIKQLKKDIL